MSEFSSKDTTLYLGNLDPSVNELLLYELFLQFAPVKTVRLPKDKITREHRGYGFVQFFTIKDTVYIQKLLDDLNLYNRSMKVKRVNDESQPGPNSNSNTSGSTGGGSRMMIDDFGPILHIANLNSLVDEPTLIQIFSGFGKLVKIPEIVQGSDANSLGHGFVQYMDFESSDKAIEQMNGKLILNVPVKVGYAFKKDSKTEKHGDDVERLLYRKAKENGVLPEPEDVNVLLAELSKAKQVGSNTTNAKSANPANSRLDDTSPSRQHHRHSSEGRPETRAHYNSGYNSQRQNNNYRVNKPGTEYNSYQRGGGYGGSRGGGPSRGGRGGRGGARGGSARGGSAGDHYGSAGGRGRGGYNVGQSSREGSQQQHQSYHGNGSGNGGQGYQGYHGGQGPQRGSSYHRGRGGYNQRGGSGGGYYGR
ncbi:unnamed protein product [Ambrosiozyma monospora]|uniref:Unnamed protein product n=1 Tax=Ambrosiozyma monospora TaxID=43982 RepID=A0A9W7DHD5_AMBMO|nr:unnamed protein product [Ambrosiozyma monospora]